LRALKLWGYVPRERGRTEIKLPLKILTHFLFLARNKEVTILLS
jgi:hypothetical protein